MREARWRRGRGPEEREIDWMMHETLLKWKGKRSPCRANISPLLLKGRLGLPSFSCLKF